MTRTSRRSAASSSPTGARSRSASSAPVATWAWRRSPSTAMRTRTPRTSAWPTPRSASDRRRPARATCASTPSWPPAVASGAEAVHPGYGFLAERAAFARAVEDAGLVYVGPAPATIDALGDKLNARRLAARVDVPAVPGTLDPAPVDRPDQVAAIAATAEGIGYPLLVKAAAGGGGRGMRRVERAAELPAGARIRIARGGRRVRRRIGLPRAGDPARPARRGAAARGRARHGRRAGGAGLLPAAAAPEARRGGARARAERDAATRAARDGHSARRRRPAFATRRPASSSWIRTGASGSSRSTRGSRWSTA